MIKIKKILFPTDFSRCAGQALPHALYLAQRYRAELHMIHGIILHEDDPSAPGHHFPDVEEIHMRLKEIAATRMSKELKIYNIEDLTIKQETVRGFTSASVILEYSNDNDIDIIVMGTHGRRGLGHLLLGSTAEETVRFAPCPVLTIRELENPKPIKDVERILVPVDFSEHSQRALAYAEELASIYEAGLHLLHVIEEFRYPDFYISSRASVFEIPPDIKDKSKTAMEKLLQETKNAEIKPEIHVISGYAVQEILNFSENNNIDLIVISTHGLTGLEHLLLGSVAEKVIRRAPCPVLAVKVFGKSLI